MPNHYTEPVIGDGAHDGEPGGCIMEWASLLATGNARLVDGLPELKAGVGWDDVYDTKTDLPWCTNETVATMAQHANDRCPDEVRDDFGRRFLSRIGRAAAFRDGDTEQRVNVRLALWAARQVEPNESEASATAKVLALVQQWLDGDIQVGDLVRQVAAEGRPPSGVDHPALRAALNAVNAVQYGGTYAFLCVEEALGLGGIVPGTKTSDSAEQTADALDRVLDAHQKAVADEGAWADLIELWESEACAWASEYADDNR